MEAEWSESSPPSWSYKTKHRDRNQRQSARGELFGGEWVGCALTCTPGKLFLPASMLVGDEQGVYSTSELANCKTRISTRPYDLAALM